MRAAFVALAAVAACASATPALRSNPLAKAMFNPGRLGWSADGHYITAAIATAFLKSNVATELASILSPDTVESCATWADSVKDEKGWEWSKPLHFINTPSWACKFIPSYCPDNVCVYGAILNYTSQATSGGTEQYYALKFLIHFVGDIHQPLHCGFKADEGGNEITGTFLGQSTELHMVWDNGIIQQRLTDFTTTDDHYDAYAKHLVSELQGSWADKAKEWTTCVTPGDKSCVEAWGNESAGLACTYAYTDSTGSHIQSGFDLGMDYYNFAVPIVDEQLAKGGIRLAYLLNNIFSS